MTYFDNAATTFPKPKKVRRAVANAMERYGANPGRSGHTLSIETAVKVFEAREAASQLFGSERVEDVVFTSNCTHALNTALQGVLQQGDHVIISDLEHNSVLRPVHALAARGWIDYSVAKVHPNHAQTVEEFESRIRPNTKLIACTHGSNAFGIQLPIREIGQMAAHHGVLFLVDGAQTAGVLPLHMKQDYLDFLCTAGHKSLYGPSGTGLLITPLGTALDPLLVGGTGSQSANYFQPQEMPDRLESGTVNTAGIIGLGAGIAYVQKKTLERIHRQEMEVAAELQERLANIKGVTLYTQDYAPQQLLPVVSFNVGQMGSEDTTQLLSQRGFAVRGGLHCAPLAHQKMGTLSTGTVRASVGVYNTVEQARELCRAVQKIAKTVES